MRAATAPKISVIVVRFARVVAECLPVRFWLSSPRSVVCNASINRPVCQSSPSAAPLPRRRSFTLAKTSTRKLPAFVFCRKMSHSVVITRTTTTTTSTSHLMLNTGYLRTTPGLLKLAQLVIGAVNVGLVAYYIRHYPTSTLPASSEFFFLLMAVAFLIGTFCLLASCLVSLSTGGIISKTIYELVYHTIAFLLYLVASIMLLVDVTNGRYYHKLKDAYMAASILGLIVSALYLFSALLAQRHYRGI